MVRPSARGALRLISTWNPLHRQVSRVGAREDLASVCADNPIGVVEVGPIAHQTTDGDRHVVVVDRRNPISRRQSDELIGLLRARQNGSFDFARLIFPKRSIAGTLRPLHEHVGSVPLPAPTRLHWALCSRALACSDGIVVPKLLFAKRTWEGSMAVRCKLALAMLLGVGLAVAQSKCCTLRPSHRPI
jgi:hypothetical protein